MELRGAGVLHTGSGTLSSVKISVVDDGSFLSVYLHFNRPFFSCPASSGKLGFDEPLSATVWAGHYDRREL